MSTIDLAYRLSELVLERKKFLFRRLSENESQKLRELNRQIKRTKRQIAKRQLRLEGF